MLEFSSQKLLAEALQEIDSSRESIALVPTMGFLHEGHISLIQLAKKHASKVIVSIFVNPSQFNDPKDLELYPRDLERDRALLSNAGTDFLFCPSTIDVYPEKFQSWIEPGSLAKNLCGQSRPGHFRGVATVVSILLQMIRPNFAIFGEKDFQQLRIIEQLVKDLWIHTQIIRGPIIREADGLALSSRNVRISSNKRYLASIIPNTLKMAGDIFHSGQTDSELLLAEVRTFVTLSSEIKLDYLEILDPINLLPVPQIKSGDRIFIAAFLDGIRLIDNMEF